MFDEDPEYFLIVFGLYLEDSFACGEQDIRNDGFGRDGQIVQPSAAKSSDGAPPDDKVASLACASKVSRHLSPVGRGIHP